MHYHSQRDLYEDLDSGREAERIQRNKEVQVSDVKAKKTERETLQAILNWCNTDPTTPPVQCLYEIERLCMERATQIPADDSDLITADWLHTTSMEYCDVNRAFIALDDIGNGLIYNVDDDRWRFNALWIAKQPRTRWELRRLADALGFDIKEGKT